MRLIKVFLLLILSLLAVQANSQILINSYAIATPQTATAPSPLVANALTTTTATISWNDTGADTYILQRATQSNYSDASQVYSGSNKTLDDSGLTMGATYYYRVKAQKTGQSDSDWVTDNVQTISFMPVAWYEPTGMVNLTDNAYVTMDGAINNRVNVLKSIINTSGPSATFGATKGARIKTDDGYAFQQLNNAAGVADLASDITFTGDFTIIIKMKLINTPVNTRLMSNKNLSTQDVRLSDINTFFIGNAGTNTTLDLPADLILDNHYDVVIQRNSGIFRVSVNGGQTWVTAGAANNNNFVVNRLFGSSTGGSQQNYYKRVVFEDSALSSAQITEVLNYLKRSDYTPEVVSVDFQIPDNLSWTPFSGGYIVNSSLDNVTTSSHIRECLSIIDNRYAVILAHYKNESPTYGEDVLYIWDLQSDLIAGPLRQFPPIQNNENDHNNGSIFKFDSRLFQIEQIHYGEYEATPFRIMQSLGGYNLKKFNQITFGKGLSTDVGTLNQYHQVNTLNGNLFIYTHELLSGHSPYVNVYKTTDRLNFFEKNRIVEATTGFWFYYYIPRNTGTETYIFLNYLNDPVSDAEYPYCFALKTTDGYTFTNISGSFSKDIRNSNAITVSELTANCVFTQASSVGNAAYTTVGVYDNGEVSGICSNGSNTGHDWFFIESGSTTKRPMTYGGRSVETTISVLADASWAYWKVNDQERHCIIFGTNGGNWQLEHYKTMDKGLTTEFVGVLNSDTSKKHQRIIMNKDNPRDSWVVIAATRLESSTEGSLFLQKFAK